MLAKALAPRHGEDTLRIGDSDDLVVMENFGALPKEDIMLERHALIVICTAGSAQFDYDGQTFRLQENDLFLYFILRSPVSNFTASADFNCRQLWFTANEVWGIDMYGKRSLTDLVYLRQHPMVHLTDADFTLLDKYFKALCMRMRDTSPILYQAIVRSMFGTLLLEVLSMLRRGEDQELAASSKRDGTLHGKQLADRFLELVEQSDGRIRRVSDYCKLLNVTPKYLDRQLQNAMGRTPGQMIDFYTVKAIQRRLRYTDLTIREVAAELRFPNPAFFCKYVKQHMGMTPTEFRAQYQ